VIKSGCDYIEVLICSDHLRLRFVAPFTVAVRWRSLGREGIGQSARPTL